MSGLKPSVTSCFPDPYRVGFVPELNQRSPIFPSTIPMWFLYPDVTAAAKLKQSNEDQGCGERTCGTGETKEWG